MVLKDTQSNYRKPISGNETKVWCVGRTSVRDFWMVRLGLQLVSMFCVKHFGLGFSRVFPSGEFGNGNIQKTSGKGSFSMINGINSF